RRPSRRRPPGRAAVAGHPDPPPPVARPPRRRPPAAGRRRAAQAPPRLARRRPAAQPRVRRPRGPIPRGGIPPQAGQAGPAVPLVTPRGPCYRSSLMIPARVYHYRDPAAVVLGLGELRGRGLTPR